jgi:hypothetical protein
MTTTRQSMEFLNQNFISDGSSVDDDIHPHNTQQPKKVLKAAFDLVHPELEEKEMKERQEKEAQKLAIEKTQGNRFDKYKIFLYATSLLGLLFFSYKRWFPLLRNPFF